MSNDTLSDEDYEPRPRSIWPQTDDVDFLLKELRSRIEFVNTAKQQSEKSDLRLIIAVNSLIIFSAGLPIAINKYSLPQQQSYFATFLVAGLFIMSSMIFFVYITLRGRRMMREDLSLKIKIIDRLTRRMSQIVDKGKISFSQKILADIVLAEAESVIYRFGRKDARVF